MNTTEHMTTVKRIAITSQEKKKTDLIEWSYFKKDVLSKHELVATGTTADILEGTVNTPVQKIPSGIEGGYRQLAEMIEAGKLDAIIFFTESAKEAMKNADVKHLVELAISKNIIVCCNRTTADYVLESLLMNRSYTIEGPGYSPENLGALSAEKTDDTVKIAV